MFVVLNTKESGKRKIRRGKTVDKVYEYPTGGGERFYIVDVLDSETGVNWDEVAYFTGKHGKSVLLDRNIAFPDYCLLERFEPLDFKNLLLFNTLSTVFKQLYLYGYRMNCYIHDPKGLYAAFLPKTVRYASETVVITKSSFRYFSEASSVYADFGASVTITDKAEITDKAAIIIDTDGSFEETSAGIRFSVDGSGMTPAEVDGFDHLKSLCPPYIDTLDFLGAVYQRNREKSLENAVCRSFRSNDETLSVSDILQMITNIKNQNINSAKSVIFYV